MSAGYINRVKDKLYRTYADGLFSIGAEKQLLSSKRGASILCYHGVDKVGDKTLNMRFVAQQSLELHFSYFKKYFNVISLPDFFERKFSKERFNVALTFDDGYLNNYKYLVPLAGQYELPVSIYVTGLKQTPYPFLWADFLDIVTRYSDKKTVTIEGILFVKGAGGYVSPETGETLPSAIRRTGHWNFKVAMYEAFGDITGIVKKHKLEDYCYLMNDDEIRKASQSKYVTIGSHGYFHNNLQNIPLASATDELVRSKNYLELLTQTEVTEIAYPDGSYSREVINAAEATGYKNQLALNYRFADDVTDNRIFNRHGMYPVYSDYCQVYSIPALL